MATNANNCYEFDRLVVSGVGTRSVETSIAEIELVLRSSAETALEAGDDVAEYCSAFVSELKSYDAEVSNISEVSIRPTYEDFQYEASCSVTLEVHRDHVEEFLDFDGRNADLFVSSLSFKAQEKLTEEVKNGVLEDAVKNARMKAEIVAETSEVDLGRVVRIEVLDCFSTPPAHNPFDFGAKLCTRSKGNNEQTISARVSIIYVISQQ